MRYQLSEKRSPTYLLPITAADANPIPEKREPMYVVFIDADGNPIDIGGGSGFTKMENQAASTASTIAGLVSDFNSLLTKLKAAGMME